MRFEWEQSSRLQWQMYEVLRAVAGSMGGQKLPPIPPPAFNPMSEIQQ
jgi:hypothetical protein